MMPDMKNLTAAAWLFAASAVLAVESSDELFDRAAKCRERGEAAEAVKYYRKAAEAGHAKAQYNLGVCYDEGVGVAKDPAQAFAWYSKAAEKGNKDAKAALQALQDRQKTRKEQARKVPATDEA